MWSTEARKDVLLQVSLNLIYSANLTINGPD